MLVILKNLSEVNAINDVTTFDALIHKNSQSV